MDRNLHQTLIGQTFAADWVIVGAESSDWYITLEHKTIPEARLHVSCREGEKFEFTGNFPRALGTTWEPDRKDRITCGVSKTRASAAILAEVTRRLIVPYLVQLEEGTA